MTKPTEGSSGVFNLLALTLQQGQGGTEVYVALQNDSVTPACTAALTIALLDKNGDTLATSSAGLPVRQFYRFSLDASSEPLVAGCVAAGEVSMAAIRDLPPLEVGLEAVSVSYWLNYWDLSDRITPLEGTVTISDVRSVMRSGGVAYRGVVVNGLAEPSIPAVSVFPTNRVGRPLGVAYSQGSEELPHGGRWEFETTTVPEAGTGFAAYPVGM